MPGLAEEKAAGAVAATTLSGANAVPSTADPGRDPYARGGVVVRKVYVRFVAIAASLTGLLLAGGAGWTK